MLLHSGVARILNGGGMTGVLGLEPSAAGCHWGSRGKTPRRKGVWGLPQCWV